MDFGSALKGLKAGHLMAREGWNGKGMYIFYAKPITFALPINVASRESYPVGNLREHLVMRTAQGDFVPWLSSQSDTLATDWMEV